MLFLQLLISPYSHLPHTTRSRLVKEVILGERKQRIWNGTNRAFGLTDKACPLLFNLLITCGIAFYRHLFGERPVMNFCIGSK